MHVQERNTVTEADSEDIKKKNCKGNKSLREEVVMSERIKKKGGRFHVNNTCD